MLACEGSVPALGSETQLDSVWNGLKSVLSVTGRVVGESGPSSHSADTCFLGEKWTVRLIFIYGLHLWISFRTL